MLIKDCCFPHMPAATSRQFAALGALLFTLAPVPRSAAADSGSEEVIKQLERDRQKAFVDRNLAALDEQTADDYTTINPAGKLSDKPQMMRNLRAGNTKVLSNSLHDLKARLYGETAVLTGRLEESSETAGKLKQSETLFTRVFVKRNGKWQAVAYHATQIARD